MAKQNEVTLNFGLGPNWQPVDAPPIRPGMSQGAPPLPHPMPAYYTGSLSPSMMHDSTLVGTQYGGSSIPSYPLMPLPGIATQTASILAAANVAASVIAHAAINRALPGTVSGSGKTSFIAPANLGNVAKTTTTMLASVATPVLIANWVNPNNILTGSPDLFSSIVNATSANETLTASGYSSVTGVPSSLVLNTKSYFDTLAAGSNGYVDYSLDSGVTWTNIRTVPAATPDTLPVLTQTTLALGTNVALLAVRATVPGGLGSTGSTPTNYCGTAVDDASIGTAPWVSPASAEGPPTGLYTSFSSPSYANDVSHNLLCTGFGFSSSVPVGAVIVGVAVTFIRSGDQRSDAFGLENSVLTNSLKLYVGGAITGTDLGALGSDLWPTTFQPISYGGATTLWGLSLTDVQVSDNTNYGCAISGYASQNMSGLTSGRIESVSMTVYFSLSGAGSSSARIFSSTVTVSYG